MANRWDNRQRVWPNANARTLERFNRIAPDLASAAKSQPPPDRRRPNTGLPRPNSPTFQFQVHDYRHGNYDYNHGFRDYQHGKQQYQQHYQQREQQAPKMPSPTTRMTTTMTTTRTTTSKRDDSDSSKDYRLIVNNLSSTVKWREISDFMSREGDLSLADHGRRQVG